jgi:hypothetical protein
MTARKESEDRHWRRSEDEERKQALRRSISSQSRQGLARNRQDWLSASKLICRRGKNQ